MRTWYSSICSGQSNVGGDVRRRSRSQLGKEWGKNIPGKSMSRGPTAEGGVGRRINSKLVQCGWCGKNKECHVKLRLMGCTEARLCRVSCQTC